MITHVHFYLAYMEGVMASVGFTFDLSSVLGGFLVTVRPVWYPVSIRHWYNPKLSSLYRQHKDLDIGPVGIIIMRTSHQNM